MRWVLLDEVVAVKKQQGAFARARVPSGDVAAEPLMIEMMAQAGALLLGAENDYSQDVVFAKIQEAEFFGEYSSGQPIEIEATCENLRPEGAWITGRIHADGKDVAKAQLMLMTVGHFFSDRQQPITFHEAFMNHYRIREKVQ